jgi:HK97 family phage prohead protease
MITLHATPGRPGPDGNAEAARFWPLELRDAQAVGKPYRYLEGRAVPYGVAGDLGWFVETHAVGSLKKSTREGAKNAPLLISHDNRDIRAVAGHAEEWRHEDDGLHGIWRLNDSEYAQRAAALADNGDLRGLSIGFQPILSTWELLDLDEWDPSLGPDHKDRVTRLESRLLEVSIVSTPAFAEAAVTAVREATVYTRAARLPYFGELEADRWRARLATVRAGGRFAG